MFWCRRRDRMALGEKDGGRLEKEPLRTRRRCAMTRSVTKTVEER